MSLLRRTLDRLAKRLGKPQPVPTEAGAEKPASDRRLLKVKAEVLADLFRLGSKHHYIVTEGLSPDSVIVGIDRYDEEDDMIYLWVDTGAFSPSRPGDNPPVDVAWMRFLPSISADRGFEMN